LTFLGTKELVTCVVVCAGSVLLVVLVLVVMPRFVVCFFCVVFCWDTLQVLINVMR
jgi:hypothetical protein